MTASAPSRASQHTRIPQTIACMLPRRAAFCNRAWPRDGTRSRQQLGGARRSQVVALRTSGTARPSLEPSA